MAQEKNVTRNLILLLIGMIVIYLLQKNGNFFPILFVVLSIFLIWKNKSGFSKRIKSQERCSRRAGKYNKQERSYL